MVNVKSIMNTSELPPETKTQERFAAKDHIPISLGNACEAAAEAGKLPFFHALFVAFPAPEAWLSSGRLCKLISEAYIVSNVALARP